MSEAEELKRLREAVQELQEVIQRHRKGEVGAYYVVGWLEATLRRVETGK